MEDKREVPKQMDFNPAEIEKMRQQQTSSQYYLVEFTTEEGTIEKVGIVANTIFEALYKFARKFSEINCEELSVDVTLITVLR